MTLDQFRDLLDALCRRICDGHDGTPDSAAARVAALLAEATHHPEDLYRVLRRTVTGRRPEGDQRDEAFAVAVHDILLLSGEFAFDAEHMPDLLLFDEDYYRNAHPDIAEAVRSGALQDGFSHFRSCGAQEGRIARCRITSAASSWLYDDESSRQPTRWERVTGVVDQLPREGVEPLRERIGINLIGFHSANLGLGVSARHYQRFLDGAGFEVCPVEIPVPGGRFGHDTSYAERWHPLDRPAPHDINLILMNPAEIATFVDRDHAAAQTAGKINVALPFWELAYLPRNWIPPLQAMDVVLSASGFIRHALAAALDGPKIRDLAHPIYLPDGVTRDRSRFELPEDHVVFACSFEMASDINRKNPFAAIEAFNRAFPVGSGDRATLVVKVNNARLSSAFADHVERLQRMAASNPSIRILDVVLEYRDVLSLFASADVFVSLHRAEGLGLCLMEAMTLGRPVIATAWSGNMAFMTEQNSCLVDYTLEPVVHSTQVSYSRDNVGDATWASADVDHAVHWMRRLYEEPELRERLGARAASDLAEYQRRIDADELRATLQNLRAQRD